MARWFQRALSSPAEEPLDDDSSFDSDTDSPYYANALNEDFVWRGARFRARSFGRPDDDYDIDTGNFRIDHKETQKKIKIHLFFH